MQEQETSPEDQALLTSEHLSRRILEINLPVIFVNLITKSNRVNNSQLQTDITLLELITPGF